MVKNDFYQVDYGNSYISNLVTVQVPDVKPEKHALDQKDDKKIRDGQEIQIGEYLRYLLDGVTVPSKHDTLYQSVSYTHLDVYKRQLYDSYRCLSEKVSCCSRP